MPTRTNLKELRAARGLSQTAVADKIGTTLNHYGKLERGSRRLNMDWLRKLAIALEVRIEDIVAELESEDAPSAALPGGFTPEAVRAMVRTHLEAVMNQNITEELLADVAERMCDSIENWKDDPAAARDPQVARSVARQINRRFDQ